MEEILASIRRIIADDQESAKAPEPAPARPGKAPPEDDILDLAEIATPPPPPSLDIEQDDVDFRDADGQIDFDALDIGEEEPAPEPELEEPEFDEPEPVFARALEPPAFEPPIFEPERLVSSATDGAVSQAFNMLAHTVLTNNARTLEDLVKEMLRPMLKNWLDDNLPTMVERLVRAEIERVARGGR